MSTKCTIYSSETPNIHIYYELVDGNVWVDFESPSAATSIRLMTSEEWEVLIAGLKKPKVSIDFFEPGDVR